MMSMDDLRTQSRCLDIEQSTHVHYQSQGSLEHKFLLMWAIYQKVKVIKYGNITFSLNLHVIHRKINTLDSAINRKYLQQVVFVYVACQPANVDPGWPRGGRTWLSSRPR